LSQQQQSALSKNSIDVDSIKPCQNCGLIVWLGEEKDMPNGVVMAFPPGSNWIENPSAEPYCSSCWDTECEVLKNLSAEYKAVGKATVIKRPAVVKAPAVTKRKKPLVKAPAVAKRKKPLVKAPAVAKRRKGATKRKKKKKVTVIKKKKQLGGVQGRLIDSVKTQSTAQWHAGQSVNARYSDGKYYGAFISNVNGDGTYQVYFAECGTVQDGITENDLKVPIMSGKTAKSLDKYRGQVFFDEGGVDEVTGSYFEPGEFVVKAVAPDNNFMCTRVESPDDEGEPFDISYVIKRIRKYEEE